MLDSIMLSILTAAVIMGIRKASEPDYILHPIYNWFVEVALNFEHLTELLKPIILCQYCMSSFWTILVGLLFLLPIKTILVAIPATCGIIAILKPNE